MRADVYCERAVVLRSGSRAWSADYVAHYHRERNHQGLGNELITPESRPLRGTPVRCRERLGGLLRYYHRAA